MEGQANDTQDSLSLCVAEKIKILVPGHLLKFPFLVQKWLNWKALSLESTNWDTCHYYPSDFPDPALTLAVTPSSRGVGTPLATFSVPDSV